ncbi:transposase [Candidatus Daviesbacteria bacterium]|nr:transposase [Candidatus Daviesbacteria bacterium]
MPARIIPLINGQFYHIYNRGVEKRRIYENRRTYTRFLQAINYYRLEGPKPKFSNFIQYKSFEPDPNKKIVDIVCYCLMPNHFHFLIKQLKEGGISEFISKLTNSYTKFYNTKFNRVGPLLQGQFKAVLIESDEQLVHVSRYIHLNSVSSFLTKKPEDYEWSSYNEYLNGKGVCTKEEILNFFKSVADYKKFTDDQISYAQELELIKHQLLDGED